MNSVVLWAQGEPWKNYPPDPKWEVSASYGASIITNPKGPLNDYQGTSTNFVRDIAIKGTYMISPRFNIALDIGFRKWTSKAMWLQPYYFGQSINPTEVKISFGNPAISECLQANYCFPHYSKFRNTNNANLYVGATLGIVTTVSDGSVAYGKYNAPPDSSYQVVTAYNYAQGIGYTIGFQAGYTRYIYRNWGLNIEGAVRYVNMATDKPMGKAYLDGNDKYHMMHFPINIGVKYRFNRHQ
ncbi:MAG: hypothetical protein EBX41_01735 [Chitinophagia bacterium]|nr:hypothetical protein [Chitinophagia bacterium]